MIVHGKQFIPDLTEQQIQPNAVDVTISELFEFVNYPSFKLTAKGTVHRDRVPCFTRTEPDIGLVWELAPSHSYPFNCKEKITVPEGYVAWLITRSSLNRNGIFIQAGLYDSGFVGQIGGTIYNLGGLAYIQPDQRVAQIVFAKAETLRLYDGQYQGKGC